MATAKPKTKAERRAFTGPGLTASIRVSSNATSVQRALRNFAAEQLPFAVALALTQLALDSRDYVRPRMRQHFTIRNPYVQRGVTIEGARKSDWPRQSSKVGTLDPWMPQHVTGAIKRPQQGAAGVAVPTRIVRRTGSGAVVPSEKPTTLRNKPSVDVLQLQGKANRLIVEDIDPAKTIRSTVKGKRVQRRDPRANLGTATWYFLRPSVRVRKTWPFEQEVRRTVAVRYEPRFTASLKRGAATSAERAVRSAVQLARAANVLGGKLRSGQLQ